MTGGVGAWIRSWNTDNYQGTCIALYSINSINVPPQGCAQLLGALCEPGVSFPGHHLKTPIGSLTIFISPGSCCSASDSASTAASQDETSSQEASAQKAKEEGRQGLRGCSGIVSNDSLRAHCTQLHPLYL